LVETEQPIIGLDGRESNMKVKRLGTGGNIEGCNDHLLRRVQTKENNRTKTRSMILNLIDILANLSWRRIIRCPINYSEISCLLDHSHAIDRL
jgi:hypothetical protein